VAVAVLEGEEKSLVKDGGLRAHPTICNRANKGNEIIYRRVIVFGYCG